MRDPYQFLIVALVVLVAYLCLSVRRRWRAEEAKWRARELHFPGKAFDVSQIAPRVQRVRANYPEAAHARTHQPFHHGGLLAAARRWVASLAYFHRDTIEHAKHNHTGNA